MHLYLALFFHRDYFGRLNASLLSSFSPQGLFRPAGFISVLLFCSTGIISTRSDASLACSFSPQGLFRPGQMHLYPALLLRRDYFDRPDASLSFSFSPQGLFRPAGCISIFLFFTTGIISTGRMHLYLALLLHRDYFDRSDTSPLAESISARPCRSIPVYLPRH